MTNLNTKIWISEAIHEKKVEHLLKMNERPHVELEFYVYKKK